MKTMQQAYETMRAGILAQGCRSLSSAGFCAYRGVHEESGAVIKCAVGHLILDEHYDPKIESQTADEIDILEILNESGYAVLDGLTFVEFLLDAQDIHDNYSDNGPGFCTDFAGRLDGLAEKYGLEVVKS